MLLYSEGIYISDKSKISETRAIKDSQMQVDPDFKIQVSWHPKGAKIFFILVQSVLGIRNLISILCLTELLK